MFHLPDQYHNTINKEVFLIIFQPKILKKCLPNKVSKFLGKNKLEVLITRRQSKTI